jgi:hypothetical protein
MTPRHRARLFVAIIFFCLGLAALASAPAWADDKAAPSMLDWNMWRFFGDLLMGAVVTANTLYTWFANRSRVNKAAIDSLEKELHGIRGRVGVLESEVKHLPNHDDLGDLHEKVNRVAHGMERMGGQLDGINRTLGLIHESLLSERNSK